MNIHEKVSDKRRQEQLMRKMEKLTRDDLILSSMQQNIMAGPKLTLKNDQRIRIKRNSRKLLLCAGWEYFDNI